MPDLRNTLPLFPSPQQCTTPAEETGQRRARHGSRQPIPRRRRALIGLAAGPGSEQVGSCRRLPRHAAPIDRVARFRLQPGRCAFCSYCKAPEKYSDCYHLPWRCLRMLDLLPRGLTHPATEACGGGAGLECLGRCPATPSVLDGTSIRPPLLWTTAQATRWLSLLQLALQTSR